MIPFRDDVPAKRYPVVTVLIILANIVVFAYQTTLSPGELSGFVYRFGVVPNELLPQRWDNLPGALIQSRSLLSSMFLHGGFLHLIGNMWYLWIFGDNVEDRMGRFRFLAFYLLCGVTAGLVHFVAEPLSAVPAIGASGAVAGVLGAYLISFPFARVLTLVPLLLIWPILPLPSVLVLGSWFLVQLLSGVSSISGASDMAFGVAWWAHIGGFIAGMMLVEPFVRWRRPYLR